MLKKLIFGPLFLLVFAFLIYQLAPLLKSSDLIFSLSLSQTLQLVIIAAFVCTSSFLFALFVLFASNFRISLPLGLVTSLIPFIFIPPPLALIFAAGIFISLLLINLSLDNTLKTYLNFQPAVILGPSIRHLSTLLILSFCLIYFFSVTKIIAQDGFALPETLIDTALKMANISPSLQQESPISQLPAIDPQQLNELKQNPDLLKQAGIDPKMLDSLSNPQAAQSTQKMSEDLIKQAVQSQIQNFIKPFLGFIPGLLAILLFFILQSFVSFLNLLIYPLLWITFYILRSTGFVRFEVEMREVKKLVV